MLSSQTGWPRTAEFPSGFVCSQLVQTPIMRCYRPAGVATLTRADFLSRGAIRLLFDAVYQCCRARYSIWRVISTKLVTLLPADLRSKANSAPIRPTSDNAGRRTACKPTSSSRQPPPSSSGLRSRAPTPTSCPSFLMSCHRVRRPHIRLCRCVCGRMSCWFTTPRYALLSVNLKGRSNSSVVVIVMSSSPIPS